MANKTSGSQQSWFIANYQNFPAGNGRNH